MRATLLVLALALCAAGGSLGFWLVRRPESRDARQGYAAAPAESGAERATAADVRRLEGQVRSLRDEMAQLSAELGSLRASTGRETAAPRSVTESEPTALTINSEQRRAVLQILAEDRDAREQERARQRRQREEEVLAARAQRIAGELGLGPTDEARLAGILALDGQKRSQLFERVRDEGWDRELVRKGIEELRSWRDAEYEAAFGADVAAKIRESSGTQGFERGSRRSSEGGQDLDQRRGGSRRGN
jgi:hypothetical protein